MIQLKLAPDGGIEVDEEMRSSCEQVYAVGDACTVQWSDVAFHWFQVGTDRGSSILSILTRVQRAR